MILTHVDLIVKLLHYNIYEKEQDWAKMGTTRAFLENCKYGDFHSVFQDANKNAIFIN